MTPSRMGYMIGIAASGMMLGLMGQEVAALETWAQVFTPGFVGEMFLHASVVIAAFVGGRLIPS